MNSFEDSESDEPPSLVIAEPIGDHETAEHAERIPPSTFTVPGRKVPITIVTG